MRNHSVHIMSRELQGLDSRYPNYAYFAYQNFRLNRKCLQHLSLMCTCVNFTS